MGRRYRVAPSSSFSLFFRNDILENISQSSSSLKQTALCGKDIDTPLGSWGRESPLEKRIPPTPQALKFTEMETGLKCTSGGC